MRYPLTFILCISFLLNTTYYAFAQGDNQQAHKLIGEVIGSVPFYDYQTGKQTTDTNKLTEAFDGDLTTYYASYKVSNTWVGLDLGTPHIITKIGYAPRQSVAASRQMRLGLFEGSNRPDFLDAVPLYIIDDYAKLEQMSYADINNSKGYRYVRYCGTNTSRCQIAELEFYGYESEGDDSQLYTLTNLPTVTVKTTSGNDPKDKENQLPAYISIISDDGRTIIADSGTIRLRGNASMNFAKKPYRIKFAKKYNVLGSSAKAKKWCLINNYGDKSLIRNMVAFELSRILEMPYTPFCTMVDVIVNGEYKGCYQLADQVQVHKQRVAINEMSRNDIEGESLTGDYFIEVDAYAAKEPSYFYSDYGTQVTIKSPEADSIMWEQEYYISSAYSQMEENPLSFLDTNTFLRHFLVGEMSANTDTYWSVFMTKKRSDPLFYTGPVWDFDLAFDNDKRTYPTCDREEFICLKGGSYEGYMRPLVKEVLSDEESWLKAQQIWYDARQKGLTEQALVAYIDSLAEVIDQSQRLNFYRWNILNTLVHQNPVIRYSFDAEIDALKEFVHKRLDWMDQKLDIASMTTSTEQVLKDIDNEFDADKSIIVYDIMGRVVSREYDVKRLKDLQYGIYIIQQEGKTKKIIIQ